MSVHHWQFRQLLTMQQAGDYLTKSAEAARKFLKRHQVPLVYCGRELRVDKRDIDAFLNRETKQRIGVA